MLSSEQKLAHTLLCFMDQTPDSTALNIYSSCLCVHPLYHNHDTKEAFMCHSVPVSLCALSSPLQNSNLYSNTTKYSQPDWSMLPDHLTFVSKMLLTRKSIANRPCQVLYTIFPPVYCKEK
jgi:hypothetical protein